MPTAERFKFIKKPWLPVFLWFAAAVIIPLVQFFKGSYNNYNIFKGAFYHLIYQQPLYANYPAEYFDTNHYGPFFGVIMAPFALLPNAAGMVLWSVANTWLLYKAIRLLPLSVKQITWIYWIAFIELTTAHHSLQSNPALTAWIILSFVFIQQKKEHWAALFPVLGFFVKIYGVVALALGVFAQKKGRLALFVLIWIAVLFGLPMLFSSPQFVVQSYIDWWHSLVDKNDQNVFNDPTSNMQNISVMGLISRLFNVPGFPLLAVLVPAAVCMLAPLARFKQYNSLQFQMYYLAALLLSIVLFSTGSESPTFIIAVTGAAIFFVLQPRPFNPWITFLLCFMLLLTCLSPTDIFPRTIRKQIIQPYALKAFPPFLIWLTVIYQLLTQKFTASEVHQ